MTKPAAISGYLVDIRNLGYEKSIVLKITVPAELAMSVMEIFGWPTSVDPVSVAIARLNENRKGVIEDTKASSETDTPPRSDVGGPTPDGASVPDKPIRRRTPVALEKRLAQQAGICCSDPVFQKYLRDYGYPVQDEASAAETVRFYCRVTSRAEILPNTSACKRWDKMYSKFIAWRDAPEMADT